MVFISICLYCVWKETWFLVVVSPYGRSQVLGPFYTEIQWWALELAFDLKQNKMGAFKMSAYIAPHLNARI